jgi:hypothetical protein
MWELRNTHSICIRVAQEDTVWMGTYDDSGGIPLNRSWQWRSTHENIRIAIHAIHAVYVIASHWNL